MERHDEYRKALTMLFWGMVVVALDLRVNGFDLLPDLVGWTVAAIGLHQLALRQDDPPDAAYGGRLAAAIGLTWLAAALSLPDLLLIGVPAPVEVLGYLAIFSAPIAAAYALLRLAELHDAAGAAGSLRLSIAVMGASPLVVAIALALRTDATTVVAVVYVLGALAHYLVSVRRLRATFG